MQFVVLRITVTRRFVHIQFLDYIALLESLNLWLQYANLKGLNCLIRACSVERRVQHFVSF